jgi:hypothetical protein
MSPGAVYTPPAGAIFRVSIAMVLWFAMIFAAPFPALVGLAINATIIYGLTRVEAQEPHMFDGNYPFMDVLWTAIVIFAWMIWLWMAIVIFGDIFRRRDTSGFSKVLWTVFIVLVPFLGVLVYMLANNSGIAERNLEQQRQMQASFDERVRSAAGGSDATAQIANAKQLLDTGAITTEEYTTLKRKALG